MRKELYEVTIDYTKDYNGESWIATISDEKYIDMDTFERTKADLEAKLAEKDEELLEKNRKIGELEKCEFVSTILNFNKLSADNCRLREQLAEKEKEIKKLTLLYFGDENTETILTTNKMINHIKISFAVEQLDLLYKTLTTESVWRAFKKGWWLDNGECKQLKQTIDNQIKQLKKME